MKRWHTREFDVEQPGGWRLIGTPERRIIAALAFCDGISTADLERLTPKNGADFLAHIEHIAELHTAMTPREGE